MKNTLSIYIMIIVLSIIMLSCVLPDDENYDIIEETAVESDSEQEDETDEIIIIEEVHSMELQPIKEYEGYVKTEGKLFGISGDSLEEIMLMDTEDKIQPLEKFFLKDGMIYMSVEVTEVQVIPDSDPEESENVLKEYFFMQENGDLQTVQSIPTMPVSERVQFSDTVFQINNSTYGELEISNVSQMPAVEAYIKVDGCKRTVNGLWFSVPESYSSRLKGVYFWGVDSGKTVRVKTEGRIW